MQPSLQKCYKYGRSGVTTKPPTSADMDIQQELDNIVHEAAMLTLIMCIVYNIKAREGNEWYVTTFCMFLLFLLDALYKWILALIDE